MNFKVISSYWIFLTFAKQKQIFSVCCRCTAVKGIRVAETEVIQMRSQFSRACCFVRKRSQRMVLVRVMQRSKFIYVRKKMLLYMLICRKSDMKVYSAVMSQYCSFRLNISISEFVIRMRFVVVRLMKYRSGMVIFSRKLMFIIRIRMFFTKSMGKRKMVQRQDRNSSITYCWCFESAFVWFVRVASVSTWDRLSFGEALLQTSGYVFMLKTGVGGVIFMFLLRVIFRICFKVYRNSF